MSRADQRERYHRQAIEAERTHREALMRELERVRQLTPTEIRSLFAVYPPLRRLIWILADAADLQDPLTGRAIDGSSPLVKTKGGNSRDEGASTRSDRMRVRRWITRLEGITRSFEQEIGGQPVEDSTPVRLICYRKSCKGRGRHQPWGVSECKWCGREFQ